MAILIRNVRVIDPASLVDVREDVLMTEENIELCPHSVNNVASLINGENLVLIPGLVDLHVHFREPGFIHKETIASGVQRAFAGGVTSALIMPNTFPAIDCAKRALFQQQQGHRYGFNLMVAAAASVSLGGDRASDVASLKQASVKALTDDGKPVLGEALMEEIFRGCRRHDLVFMQHAEDLRISLGASISEGKRSQKFGLIGQPKASEFSLIERDIRLAERLSARYHVLHLSCRESLDLIRRAKKDKVKISCEVTPHHLMLADSDVHSALQKMNPPLRTIEDRRALFEALADGLIDCVASDHAPHSRREKSMPLVSAPFGVVGLESAILVLLTLVKKKGLSLTRAIESMTTAPAKIIGEKGRLGTLFGHGNYRSAVLLDINHKAIFGERNLMGTAKNSPFIGMELYGSVLATLVNGKIMSSNNSLSLRLSRL